MSINFNPSLVLKGLVHYLDPAQSVGESLVTQTICATATEGQNLEITAPPGYTFTSVEFASYGTPEGECGSFIQSACHAENSVSIVESYLIGEENTVSIPATNTVFSDPCSGTFKRLYVQATATAVSNQSIRNSIGGTSLWNVNQMGIGETTALPSFESNAKADGSGSSYITVSRDGRLETGSITFQIWFNLKNIPLNVGSNNNWRAMLPNAADPLRIVLEQSYVLNFTTDTTDGNNRRNLNGVFAPLTVDPDGWQFITYMYDQATGEAACYKNDVLVRSGPMTDSSGASPTQPGNGLRYTNYTANGFRIYGGTNFSANPSGNGVCPGEVGNIMFYNRALTQSEVINNYNVFRERYI